MSRNEVYFEMKLNIVQLDTWIQNKENKLREIDIQIKEHKSCHANKLEDFEEHISHTKDMIKIYEEKIKHLDNLFLNEDFKNLSLIQFQNDITKFEEVIKCDTHNMLQLIENDKIYLETVLKEKENILSHIAGSKKSKEKIIGLLTEYENLRHK